MNTPIHYKSDLISWKRLYPPGSASIRIIIPFSIILVQSSTKIIPRIMKPLFGKPATSWTYHILKGRSGIGRKSTTHYGAIHLQKFTCTPRIAQIIRIWFDGTVDQPIASTSVFPKSTIGRSSMKIRLKKIFSIKLPRFAENTRISIK